MKRLLYIIAIGLLIILAVPALVYGFGFLKDPSGKSLGFDIALLQQTPFESFFYPGLILTLANGVFSVLTILLTLLKNKYRHTLIILQGCILIGWLAAEGYYAIQAPKLQYAYYAVGVLLIILGIVLKKQRGTFILKL